MRNESFAVTYGDGLTDANLGDELQFHLAHRKIGTVLGVNPPSRFGELKLDRDEVVDFAEKPAFMDNWINGGYFLPTLTSCDISAMTKAACWKGNRW